jgi:hypothetical protein
MAKPPRKQVLGGPTNSARSATRPARRSGAELLMQSSRFQTRSLPGWFIDPASPITADRPRLPAALQRSRGPTYEPRSDRRSCRLVCQARATALLSECFGIVTVMPAGICIEGRAQVRWKCVIRCTKVADAAAAVRTLTASGRAVLRKRSRPPNWGCRFPALLPRCPSQ